MSDERGSHNSGRDKKKERIWKVIKALLFGVISLGILVVLGSYGVRTPAVLGQVVGPRIADQIEDRGIDLRIGSMSGVGFTGIRFYDVELELSRGEKTVVGGARY